MAGEWPGRSQAPHILSRTNEPVWLGKGLLGERGGRVGEKRKKMEVECSILNYLAREAKQDEGQL